MTKVVLILGKSAVGKSTILNYISKRYNVKTIEASDIIKNLKSKNQKAKAILEQYGMDIVAKTIVSDKALKKEDIIFISGLRNMQEYNIISEETNLILCILVKASVFTRIIRFKKRERLKTYLNSTRKYYLKHKLDRDIGLDKLLSYVEDLDSTKVINNGISLWLYTREKNLRNNVDLLMHSISGK